MLMKSYIGNISSLNTMDDKIVKLSRNKDIYNQWTILQDIIGDAKY